jgi:hypothetical protein
VTPGQLVLVHLVAPREKFWGVLLDTAPSGVTVRGIALDVFEVWMHEVAKGKPASAHPSTVFFPLHRVERIFADETAGEVESYAERFIGVVGRNVRDYLK